MESKGLRWTYFLYPPPPFSGPTTKKHFFMCAFLTQLSWKAAIEKTVPVRSVNERGNFGGILEITLSARLQDTKIKYVYGHTGDFMKKVPTATCVH